MSIQTYATPGTYTWTWPENITHVDTECWGAGGGCGASTQGEGGGAGGHYAWNTVYKGSESSLSVVVGAGGVQAQSGASSRVVQNGTVRCRAEGGNRGVGSTGGVGPAETNSLGVIRQPGGNGGNGTTTAGGGGGSSGGRGVGLSGNNGSNATGSIGGAGGADPGGGGPGGNGGNVSAAGTAGTAPGGGGGGAGSGANGGRGGDGRVVLTWGNTQGHARFSSGCCCGVCDLTPGDFPLSMTLSLAVTATSTEYVDNSNALYGPYVVPDYVVDYFGCWGCGGVGLCTVTAPGITFTEYIEDQSFLDLLDGIDVPLELTDFSAGAGTTIIQGVLTATNHCSAIYEVALADPSIDDGCRFGYGFLGGHDRWFNIPNAIPPEWAEWESPELLEVNSTATGDCGCNSIWYYWERAANPKLYAVVSLKIVRTIAGKYYYDIQVTDINAAYSLRHHYYETGGVGCTGGELPTIDEWERTPLIDFSRDPSGFYYCRKNNYDTAGYDTGQEALAAAMGAIGGIHALRDATRRNTTSPYVLRLPAEQCGELYPGTYGCAITSDDTYVSSDGLQHYAGEGTVTATVTW